MTDPDRPIAFGPNGRSPKSALMTLRIIWLALLVGPIVFLVVASMQLVPIHRHAPSPRSILIWITVVEALTVVPVTFVIRQVIFRRGRMEGGIRPRAYSLGNTIFWAECEGVAFFGLVAAMVNGSPTPTIYVTGAALALQVLTFPFAGPMDWSTQGSPEVPGNA